MMPSEEGLCSGRGIDSSSRMLVCWKPTVPSACLFLLQIKNGLYLLSGFIVFALFCSAGGSFFFCRFFLPFGPWGRTFLFQRRQRPHHGLPRMVWKIDPQAYLLGKDFYNNSLFFLSTKRKLNSLSYFHPAPPSLSLPLIPRPPCFPQ
jgi:hypothetical protein